MTEKDCGAVQLRVHQRSSLVLGMVLVPPWQGYSCGGGRNEASVPSLPTPCCLVPLGELCALCG